MDLAQFEAAMVGLDPNNGAQTTHYDDPVHPRQSVPCFQGARAAQASGAAGDCFTGVAEDSFAADAPAQLAEYTLESDNGEHEKVGERPG